MRNEEALLLKVGESTHGKDLSPEELHEVLNPGGTIQFALIKNMAKDRALEDTMNNLKKGFEQNTIDLGEFMQQVRQLSRKQFNCKARSQKINNYLRKNNPAQATH